MLFFRYASLIHSSKAAILQARLLIDHSSFFKTLVDHEVTVELKNDISIKGVLKSVDQFLNIKLDDIQVVEELKYPHLVSPTLSPRCGRATNEEETSWSPRYLDKSANLLLLHLVVSQKRFHKRQRGSICASARGGGRCGAVGGCYEERYTRFRHVNMGMKS